MGTLAEVLELLNRGTNMLPLFKDESFGAHSLEIIRVDRPALKTYIAQEAVKWGKVVKEVGATVD